ncbi:Tim44/TimA family putative adaptor protein [Novosphingobium sp. 9]|uniref:Tim44/TimA family putative adaptor protein n=1 Tax=Novosphingobium sp. 9 TaxID=2025349 RepID=UPI0021B6D8C4|nr:Tim44/TimA family putative adaptor protein [Novosphingobium sp. 9]
MTVEIVILAMIAAFLGLRLYSVLGRRAEHEEEPIQGRFQEPRGPAGAPRLPLPVRHQDKTPAERAASAARPDMPRVSASVERGLVAIAGADRGFDAAAFVEGARGAYRMILEAFWKGDKAELRSLCDDDVYASFAAAIDARAEAGEVMDNRLIRIEESAITGAEIDSGYARITVRFQSDVAAVTRNAEGHVVAGSLDDAIDSIDVWTFARNVNSPAPDWLLDETDEG